MICPTILTPHDRELAHKKWAKEQAKQLGPSGLATLRWNPSEFGSFLRRALGRANRAPTEREKRAARAAARRDTCRYDGVPIEQRSRGRYKWFCSSRCQRASLRRTEASRFLFAYLPLAVRWAEKLERDILAAGRILTPEETVIAQRVGVTQPERIRIRSVKTIAAPRDPELAEAAEKAGLCWATMSGLTAFYGIMLVEGDYTRELLAHGCYHVRQYEEHGSIANFLEEYISQVLVWGYGDARLEREAREVARGYELTLAAGKGNALE